MVPPGPARDACPRCGQDHKEPHCADGREWGQWPPETRLADTGDIRDARLLAERIAELRARDDDAQAFMSAREAEFAQARHDLTAALS